MTVLFCNQHCGYVLCQVSLAGSLYLHTLPHPFPPLPRWLTFKLVSLTLVSHSLSLWLFQLPLHPSFPPSPSLPSTHCLLYPSPSLTFLSLSPSYFYLPLPPHSLSLPLPPSLYLSLLPFASFHPLSLALSPQTSSLPMSQSLQLPPSPSLPSSSFPDGLISSVRPAFSGLNHIPLKFHDLGVLSGVQPCFQCAAPNRF